MFAEVVAKAKKIVDETGDIEIVRRENTALFKQLEENRLTAERNQKAIEESAAAEQERLKKELADTQKALKEAREAAETQAKANTDCIGDLHSQLERRLDEALAVDEKFLSKPDTLFFPSFEFFVFYVS